MVSTLFNFLFCLLLFVICHRPASAVAPPTPFMVRGWLEEELKSCLQLFPSLEREFRPGSQIEKIINPDILRDLFRTFEMGNTGVPGISFSMHSKQSHRPSRKEEGSFTVVNNRK